MSFYTSLSGLRAAQTDLSTISNNVANAGSIGFKKSRALFGDLFAAAPTQNNRMVAGQGVRLVHITQMFGQGTLESTDKTLDLAIAGNGFFTVKGEPPRQDLSFTRNGAFGVDASRNVVDSLGNKVQLLPVDSDGQVTAANVATMVDFTLPAFDPADPNAALSNIAINNEGLVSAAFANGNVVHLGSIALASFTNEEGLRPIGDGHWQATGESGPVSVNGAASGPLGTIRSGALEHANVDLTEELVALIGAQRNFQANAKAIETATAMTQTVMQMRS